MRSVSASVAAARAARSGIHAEHLFWISAKNRTTGAMETMGLWTGPDEQTFTVAGQARTYYGAGNVLRAEPIRATVGIEVRTYEVELAAISPEVEQLIRGYDTRLAPIEIHRAEFDGDGNLIAISERIFKGWIDGAPITTPEIGGEASARVRLVSAAHALTRYGSATKSDTVQRRRSGDRFRRFGSITSAQVFWGEKSASMKEASTSNSGPVSLGSGGTDQ